MNPIRWWHNHNRTQHIMCIFIKYILYTSCGHCWHPLAWLITYQQITLAILIHIMPMKYLSGCVPFCLCYILVLHEFTWRICSHSLAFYHCNWGNCTEMYSWFCKQSVHSSAASWSSGRVQDSGLGSRWSPGFNTLSVRLLVVPLSKALRAALLL